MTGGSHEEARVSTPPRLGGLGLAGIQSGCAVAVWAETRLRPAAATRDVAPRPPHPARVRNVRRLSIAALLLTSSWRKGPRANSSRYVIALAPSAATMPQPERPSQGEAARARIAKWLPGSSACWLGSCS